MKYLKGYKPIKEATIPMYDFDDDETMKPYEYANAQKIFKYFTEYKSENVKNIECNTDKTDFKDDIYFNVEFNDLTNGKISSAYAKEHGNLLKAEIRFKHEAGVPRNRLNTTYRVFINGSIKNIVTVSQLDKVSKILETEFEERLKTNDRFLIVDKMFEVVTKEVLGNVFGNLMDEANISEILEIESIVKVGWKIFVVFNELKPIGSDFKNNLVLNSKSISILDDIMSATNRLKDISDVTVTMRYGKANEQTAFYINILANDEKGEPIGIGLIV